MASEELEKDDQAEDTVAQLEGGASLRDLVIAISMRLDTLNDKVDRLALTLAQQPWPTNTYPPYVQPQFPYNGRA